MAKKEKLPKMTYRSEVIIKHFWHDRTVDQKAKKIKLVLVKESLSDKYHWQLGFILVVRTHTFFVGRFLFFRNNVDIEGTGSN